eukprot:6597874-Prymnesium_polylepis.1
MDALRRGQERLKSARFLLHKVPTYGPARGGRATSWKKTRFFYTVARRRLLQVPTPNQFQQKNIRRACA